MKWPKFRPFSAVGKNVTLLKYGYIIYNFEARDPEISNIGNYFREIYFCGIVHKIARFKYFAKQMIYLKFPCQVL